MRERERKNIVGRERYFKKVLRIKSKLSALSIKPFTVKICHHRQPVRRQSTLPWPLIGQPFFPFMPFLRLQAIAAPPYQHLTTTNTTPLGPHKPHHTSQMSDLVLHFSNLRVHLLAPYDFLLFNVCFFLHFFKIVIVCFFNVYLLDVLFVQFQMMSM